MAFAGAATVGGGLLLGAMGVELSLHPKWDAFHAAADAGDAALYDSLKGEIEDRQQLGRVLLYSGAGLAAVGATLIVVDLITPGDSATSAAVLLLPNGTMGGAVRVRF